MPTTTTTREGTSMPTTDQQAAALARLTRRLESHGLTARPTQTGGGCEALLVHDAEGGEDGYHILVSNGNHGLPFTGRSHDIVASVYVGPEDEGSLVIDTAVTTEDAYAVAELINQHI